MEHVEWNKCAVKKTTSQLTSFLSTSCSLNHSAFNIANALGAMFGGMAIGAGYGYESMGFVGAAMAVVGFGVFLVSIGLEKADRAAAPVCPAE